MDVLPVRSREPQIVRPPQVRCQTGADPDQWDWNFREALGKRREGLGQSPGSNTEAPDRNESFEQLKTYVEFARSPGTSVELAGSTRMKGGMYPERP